MVLTLAFAMTTTTGGVLEGFNQDKLKAGALAVPIIPLIAEYEHSSCFAMQWIKDDPQYSMIQAVLNKTEPPTYQVMLVERDTGRRVYYCNSQARVNYLESTGRNARLVKIDFRDTKSGLEKPMIALGFPDEKGQPIRWRFVLASEPSERGSGVSPQSAASPGLDATYRDKSTAAGDGTAIQIGGKVSEAEPWPQISSPPYFVAFRGSYIDGMRAGSLLAGSERWRVEKAPAELMEGSEWTLASDNGRSRRLRITAVHGDEFTFSQVTKDPGSPSSLTMVARKKGDAFAVRSVFVGEGQDGMRISFNPELDLNSAGSESSFQIDEAGHDKVVGGKIQLSANGNVLQLKWQPEFPGWAKGHQLNGVVTVTADGYQVLVK
jgi:hypothetical protein